MPLKGERGVESSQHPGELIVGGGKLSRFGRDLGVGVPLQRIRSDFPQGEGRLVGEDRS